MREALKDPTRLAQMYEAIEKLLKANTERDLERYTEADIEYFGIVKLLEIIGEAAYKLTNEFRLNHPATPWRVIIDMRHVLVHGYYQIDRKYVFTTIRNDLPLLRDQIIEYLKEE